MEYSKIIAEAEDRFSNPRPQNFPLPWDMMGYIQKKWSPEVYQKLTRTCKYFYASQPWLVVNLSNDSSYFRRTLNKRFYASKPWVVINPSQDFFNFPEILNQSLNKNLKIWIAGEPKRSFARSREILYLSDLASQARFSQLLHSIKFSSVQHVSINDRKLSYSDYITVTKFKSVKSLDIRNTNVTTKKYENKIYFLDNLLKPLKNVKAFLFDSENGSDYYLKCAKRLSDFAVPKKLRKLIIAKIPEYISFKYFHRFLQKNPSITSLELRFLTADINNTFINDVQSFYSETLPYKTFDYNWQIGFQISIGNLKIEASFDKICKNCNQRVATKYFDRCPSNAEHWICEACRDAFQPGDSCSFCLAGV